MYIRNKFRMSNSHHKLSFLGHIPKIFGDNKQRLPLKCSLVDVTLITTTLLGPGQCYKLFMFFVSH